MAQDVFGLSVEIGFEFEFHLIAEHEHRDTLAFRARFKETSWNHWSAASAMCGEQVECVENCVKDLSNAGIPVRRCHAEGGQPQFEIATGAGPATQAADRLVQSQNVIRSGAVKHRFYATFLPKSFKVIAPSGIHAHLALTQEAR